jgi:hypothetical protein
MASLSSVVGRLLQHARAHQERKLEPCKSWLQESGSIGRSLKRGFTIRNESPVRPALTGLRGFATRGTVPHRRGTPHKGE